MKSGVRCGFACTGNKHGPCEKWNQDRKYGLHRCCAASYPPDIPANVLKVQLSWNAFTYVPRNYFKNLSHCVDLDLCCQQISTIEFGAFSGLVSLQFLKLGGNELSTLHQHTFLHLQSLRELQIHGNHLHFMAPEVLMNLPRPLTLFMDAKCCGFNQNGWNCSAMCWLREEILQETVTVPPDKLPRCIKGSSWDPFRCGLPGLTLLI